MEIPSTASEVHLVSRPHGWPTDENFEIVDVAVPALQPGQVLVRNQMMSVDPSMRGRLNETNSYVAPSIALGAPLDGAAVGEVVVSTVDTHAPGDLVLHPLGWREYSAVGAVHAVVLDPSLASAEAYLGVLGLTGLTAYAGLLRTAEFVTGETVFVSAAAGAVGSVVGQVARLRGASRVVGSAGSADKVRHLVEDLGFDAAFNYKDGPVAEQLAAAAPDGIDVYFDNVGGDHLEAAISALRPHGRVAVSGMISTYNATEPPRAPHNLRMIIGKRLTIRGLLATDHFDLRDAFLHEVGGWIRTGDLHHDETILDGIANAPKAFLDMLRGHNVGKTLVRI